MKGKQAADVVATVVVADALVAAANSQISTFQRFRFMKITNKDVKIKNAQKCICTVLNK